MEECVAILLCQRAGVGRGGGTKIVGGKRLIINSYRPIKLDHLEVIAVQGNVIMTH